MTQSGPIYISWRPIPISNPISDEHPASALNWMKSKVIGLGHGISRKFKQLNSLKMNKYFYLDHNFLPIFNLKMIFFSKFNQNGTFNFPIKI